MSAAAQALAQEPTLSPIARAVREVRPQKGPQEQFAVCPADIAIIGGGAFGGKTFSLLYEDTEHYKDPNFQSVTFRRETPQITNPGGLWDEAMILFSGIGARFLTNSHEVLFPSGAVAKFAHLEHENSVYAWDGSQIPLLKFDQLESFAESQFWYMLSRNRDPSGHIKPYCRATCNPDPDSFLRRLLAWWIDDTTGYAIPERSGVIRWFVREGETMTWADSREELIELLGRKDLPEDHPLQPRPMSITFIVALIWDNKIGLEKDPGYLAKLKAQARHQRERLLGDPVLGGNWNVRASAGMLFQRGWCPTLEAEPEDVIWVRAWDLAATKPSSVNPDPDWTAGVKLGKYRTKNRFVISKVARDRLGPAGVETLVENTAQADGKSVRIRLPQDPGQAGKSQKATFTGRLAGYTVKSTPVTGDKVVRFSPFSAQAEAGNVDLVAGLPEAYLRALEGFPDALHDDDADATSEAFQEFVIHSGGGAMIEHMRRTREAQIAEQIKNDPAIPPPLPIHGGARTLVDLRGQKRGPKEPDKTVAQVQAEEAAARGAKGLNGKKHSSFREAQRYEEDGE